MEVKTYNISVDAHVFDGEFQGTLTYIKELYGEFLKKNNNATIYFGANMPENVKKHFHEFKNAEYIKYKSKTSLKRIFFEIPKIIDNLRCSHAHFQYIIPFRKNKKCNYIVTIHDILFNDFPKEFSILYRLKRNLLFYLSAKRCDYLLTVSNYSKQKISKQYNIEKNKIIVTPNAVSYHFFQFKSSKENSRKYIAINKNIEKYILYVSRIEPRKNQILILKAFIEKKIWKKGFSLVFIGSNTLNIGFQNIINNLSKEQKKSIYWIEQVNTKDLMHFLNGAEFFVYPSKAEGFGIPPLEAGALCTPVLCSNNTAMADFDFFQPYLFDADNYNNFLLMLMTFIDNYKTIDVHAMQSKIKNRYSWSETFRIFNTNIFING